MSVEKFAPSRYLDSPLKRVIDIAAGATGLFPTIPVVAIIGLMIKIEDGGDIFFSQRRVGKDGKFFLIYKLRTFRDGKVTRVGRMIRPVMLDEFPQFFNILRGDMSLFGVRAIAEDFYHDYQDKYLRLPTAHEEFLETWKRAYTSAPPGGISLAIIKKESIFDRQHDTPEAVEERMLSDIEQVECSSFAFEMWLLWMFLVKLVLTLRPKSADEQSTQHI